MRKIWVIAVREYLAAVRTKSFVISLVFMPVLMGASVGIQMLIEKLAGNDSKRYVVIDRTPGQELGKAIESAAQRHNDDEIQDPRTGEQTQPAFLIERLDPSADTPEAIREQRFGLSERVRQGQLAGFLDIGTEVLKPTPKPLPPGPVPDAVSLRFQSNNPVPDAFARWADLVLNEAIVAQRFNKSTITREEVDALVRHVPLRAKGLVRRNPSSGALEETPDEGRGALFAVSAALTVLMLMVVMVGATPLMQGVLEEKMQRIAEVLLGSVRPFELMMGKLLGMMGVSLTLAAVYLAGAYSALSQLGFTELLPPSLLAWFLVYQVLAVLMFGSLFIAVGAACTDAKEAQTLLLPVMFLIMIPMFAMSQVIRDPNSSFAVGASLFPFATPMLMLTRLGLSPVVPWWEPVLGVFGVLATTVACVYAAGRIFRVGILMQGKGAKFSDLARWVFRG